MDQLASSSSFNSAGNKLWRHDRRFHEWYRFVLAYPPHLVRQYLDDFGITEGAVLDPFCGTGTTLIETKLRGLRAIGVEANPLAHFGSSVKVDWAVDPTSLLTGAQEIAAMVRKQLNAVGCDDEQMEAGELAGADRPVLSAEAAGLLLQGSISPRPLQKALVLRAAIDAWRDERIYGHVRLALAKALVLHISNLRFGPEVGVGKPKQDAPVVSSWLGEVQKMTDDLRTVDGRDFPPASVYLADARTLGKIVPTASVDAVITSPPYPNEKDYTRATRLEAVFLGFIGNRQELQNLKRRLIRSNTRGVYRGDDDDQWIAAHPEIERIAAAIEARRLALGKDSGFERMYARVTKLYFGGLARHLAELRAVLRPGAQLAYVVGDQASYLRVMIRTGELLADLAQALGYEVVRSDLFRTRLSTVTGDNLREEVVVLRWNPR